MIRAALLALAFAFTTFVHAQAQPATKYEPEVGLPIRFPAVDLLTIGAGGGSIAWVDAAGLPNVGPRRGAHAAPRS